MDMFEVFEVEWYRIVVFVGDMLVVVGWLVWGCSVMCLFDWFW